MSGGEGEQGRQYRGEQQPGRQGKGAERGGGIGCARVSRLFRRALLLISGLFCGTALGSFRRITLPMERGERGMR